MNKHYHEPLDRVEVEAIVAAYLMRDDTLRLLREALERPGTRAYADKHAKKEDER